MRQRIEPGRRVVVKVGSSSLARSGGGVDPAAIERIAGLVGGLWESGYPTVLVSSGAVAAGLAALGLVKRPSDLPGLQVAAAVGQVLLVERYARHFAQLPRPAAQVLLTKDVLANRSQYLHAREALDRMLEVGVVPIVNENDTVAVEELRMGDNDRLAAVVSHLVGASMLILLTDTPGLLAGDPRLIDAPELISAVRHTDLILDEVMRGGAGPMGSGGAATKVAAARMAAWSGIPTVVADSLTEDVVLRAVNGDEVGTWIAPHPSRLSARKLWIAFGQPSEGSIVVDTGAERAIVGTGRSLLAVGVTAVHGEFDPGSAVEVIGPDGRLIGKGLVKVSAQDLVSVMGRHSSAVGGEVIHRDDLVVLVDP